MPAHARERARIHTNGLWLALALELDVVPLDGEAGVLREPARRRGVVAAEEHRRAEPVADDRRLMDVLLASYPSRRPPAHRIHRSMERRRTAPREVSGKRDGERDRRLAGRARPCAEGKAYPSALALMASNSIWLIAPLSRSCLARSISEAAPPAPAVSRT